MTATEQLAGLIAPPSIAVPIRYAVVISVTPTTAKAVVRPSNATATDGSQDITAAYLMAGAPAVGALVRIEVYKGDVIIIGSPSVDSEPGTPFATSGGVVSVTATASTSGAASVTFPTGRFTVAPILTLTATGTTIWVPFVSALTSTGCTVTIRHIDNTALTATISVQWAALQMTSSTAAG
jgi:hypothetical protein